MAYKAENIYTDIVSTLAGITSAGGYENTIGASSVTLWAAPPEEENIDEATFPAFMVILGSDEVEEGKEILKRILRPRIRAYASNLTAPASAIISVFSDAIKAMLADRTRGGTAYNTRYMGNEPLDEEKKPYAAVEMRFEIRVEHKATSP